MEHSKNNKIKIILISIVLHGTILALLLIFYTSPEHEWIYFDTTQTTINTAETIFSEPNIQQQPILPPIAQQEEAWAELKPRASTFGDSMDMLDENDVEIGIESKENSSDDLGDEYNGQDESKEPKTNDPMVRFDTSGATHHQRELQSKSALKTQKVSAQKRQAQKALASMTRGYLEQLKHEGENLIKTIGGDPHKMPSTEQLKYERYLSKIQWCLQNAHAINRDKCQLHEPIEATMRVYFTLDRKGKMADLKIIQTSGDPFVDRYIRSLFEQASSSFPPLPAYIKEDPYQLLYTVMVCWNVASPTYMGFMRE